MNIQKDRRIEDYKYLMSKNDTSVQSGIVIFRKKFKQMVTPLIVWRTEWVGDLMKDKQVYRDPLLKKLNFLPLKSRFKLLLLSFITIPLTNRNKVFIKWGENISVRSRMKLA